MNTQSEPILGLDFGSSNSCVSYYFNGCLKAVSKKYTKTFPSALFMTQNKIYIGKNALKLRRSKKGLFIKNLKEDLVNNRKIYFKGKLVRYQVLIGKLLLYLKQKAELEIKITVKKAVLTVPAYFSENLKVILKDSAKLAGLDVLRIIGEPTAAAIYYSYLNPKTSTCVFIDIGGLTLDLALCTLMDGVIDVFEVKGDSKGGHYLVNEQIEKTLLNQVNSKNPQLYETILQNMHYLDLIQRLAQYIKVNFSDSLYFRTSLKVNFLVDEKIVPFVFTYNKNQLNKDYFVFINNFTKVYARLFKNTLVNAKDLDSAILLGGPGNSIFLRNLIKKKINVKRTPFFDNITSVAKGAALYGAQLLGTLEKVNLSDVLPISIGYQDYQSLFKVVISAGTKVPIKKVVKITTVKDFQKKIKVNIYEGQRANTKHCNYLGSIYLEDVEFNTAGNPSIELAIEITQENLIKISVKDLKTKKETDAVFFAENRLNEVQIANLKEEFRKYHREDLLHLAILENLRKLQDLVKKLEEYLPSLGPELSEKAKKLLFRKERLILKKEYDYLILLIKDFLDLFALVNASLIDQNLEVKASL